MLSSSSIIKNKCVDLQGNVEIDTHYDVSCKIDMGEHDTTWDDSSGEHPAHHGRKTHEDMFRELGKNILKNAREKSQSILRQSNEQAELIKDTAYKEGYDAGYKLGYEKSYDEAYKEAVNDAEVERQKLIDQGEMILNSCKEEYEEYFRNHEKDMINCIVNIASKIVCKEILNEGTISLMIKDELEKISQNKTVIIKANPCYEVEIKSNIEKWKLEYVLDNLFFIPIENMERGKALIEKDHGKIKIDVEYALDKLRDELTK